MEKIILGGHYTIDGAGVKLFRVFANNNTKDTDPFLLLDSFGSDNPQDYIRGFPWHPHRGIETVTYMIEGIVDHEDSMGNKGTIRSGEIQWMTAGSGILHQEMPRERKGLTRGFQLWVNLPKISKMIKPRYRGILADEIPVLKDNDTEIRVIAGTYKGKAGPVKDLIAEAEYLDVSMAKGSEFSYQAKKGLTTMCYLIQGNCDFDSSSLAKGHVVIFKSPGELKVVSHEISRFIFVAGKPLNEPIAWGGPIVMNTEQELEKAFDELEDGTFIKDR